MTPASPALAHLDLSGPSSPWAELGFAVEGGAMQVGSIAVRFVDGHDGLVGWGLRNVVPVADHLDGVPTVAVADDPDGVPTAGRADGLRSGSASHPNGAGIIDHVVVRTPDIDRTLATLATAGLELRRLREVPDSLYQQAFYRLGETILEVVGEPGRHGEAGSTLWGLVFTVADAPTASTIAGDRLGEWKDAVQPGRRIATVRRRAGLTTAVALMTP